MFCFNLTASSSSFYTSICFHYKHTFQFIKGAGSNEIIRLIEVDVGHFMRKNTHKHWQCTHLELFASKLLNVQREEIVLFLFHQQYLIKKSCSFSDLFLLRNRKINLFSWEFYILLFIKALFIWPLGKEAFSVCGRQHLAVFLRERFLSCARSCTLNSLLLPTGSAMHVFTILSALSLFSISIFFILSGRRWSSCKLQLFMSFLLTALKSPVWNIFCCCCSHENVTQHQCYFKPYHNFVF